MTNHVFEKNEEIKRLRCQNNLLWEYEKTLYEKIMAMGKNLTVLDIGCNDGSKTKDRFDKDYISKVIGIDENKTLIKTATANYGNSKFSFFCCDVETPNFEENLANFMAKQKIAAFDVIHLSFVLMHLKNPGILLRKLRKFLKKDGLMLIVDVDDGYTSLLPDPQGRFHAFRTLLEQDPYAGNRYIAEKIPSMLQDNGYKEIAIKSRFMESHSEDEERQSAMFDIYCSYLLEDLKILREKNPTREYVDGIAWIEENYKTMRQNALLQGTKMTIGIQLITCKGA